MKPRLSLYGLILLAVAGVGVTYAGDDATSLSYISYLERYVTLKPARGSETLDAVVNMPVLGGDRLETARGARVEIQLADGSTVWLDQFSTLDLDALAFSRDAAADRTAVYLAEGAAAVEIPTTAAGDGTMRLDSQAGTVFLNRPGLYRLWVEGDRLTVQAFTGLAELPVGVGSALLRAGEQAEFSGGAGQIERASISERSDDFWSWVQDRRHVPSGGATAENVDSRDAGRAAVLDNYGEWVWVDALQTRMWRPRVADDWTPYSVGRWYWTPVGWSWISYEPWGWYPSHYGSWFLDASFGWVWGWDPVWAPAWVHWIHTPGYIGWCPRGYYDWWYARNCTHCWTRGGHYPGRWSEFAFDLSGRVRLREVDPRPWTVVPTDRFTSSHLDRARLAPGRLHDLPDAGDAFVRSGTFRTPPPGADSIERGAETFFRGGAGSHGAGDLSSVLRRDASSVSRAVLSPSIVHPMRTSEVIRTGADPGAGPAIERLPGRSGGGAAVRPRSDSRWSGRSVPAPGADATGNDRLIRTTGAEVERQTPRRIDQPPARDAAGTGREVIRRDIPRREGEPARVQPPARLDQPRRDNGASQPQRMAPPPREAPPQRQAPPPREAPQQQEPPRSQSVSWVQRRSSAQPRAESRASWVERSAPAGRAWSGAPRRLDVARSSSIPATRNLVATPRDARSLPATRHVAAPAGHVNAGRPSHAAAPPARSGPAPSREH